MLRIFLHGYAIRVENLGLHFKAVSAGLRVVEMGMNIAATRSERTLYSLLIKTRKIQKV